MGMLKMEQRLGSSAVGPPPLIIITLCTRSGYSWARKVQKETLGAEGEGPLADSRQARLADIGGAPIQRWPWESGLLEASPREVAHSLQRQGLSVPSRSWDYSMHPCKFWGISCLRQGFTM